jgi:hypothetical protein
MPNRRVITKAKTTIPPTDESRLEAWLDDFDGRLAALTERQDAFLRALGVHPKPARASLLDTAEDISPSIRRGLAEKTTDFSLGGNMPEGTMHR